MNKSYFILNFMLLIFIAEISKAQSDKRSDKLYTMSGTGFSFPIGATTNHFKPKLSTSLGLNVALGKQNYFLYPKLSLHAYQYNESYPEPNYSLSLKKGRATTYLLNVALGYRKITGKFGFYGFMGAGAGIILTPQIALTPNQNAAQLNQKSNFMAISEAGIGTEYNMGGSALFVEASYMHGFSKIQNKGINVIPVAVGIKPNLSKLFDKLNRK